jgi:hypothetical protein
MKKKIFSLVAVLSLGFMACNNDGDNTAGTDTTTTTTNTTAGTVTTTGDYSAMADEFQKNSEAGKYRDARSGKNIKISVDRTTGKKLNVETNEPVTRYIFIDNNEWWVYDEEGNRIREAKMENDKLVYRGENNMWVPWDKIKWDEDGSGKYEDDSTKIKIEKDGDMKIKTNDKKVKVEDGKTTVRDNK